MPAPHKTPVRHGNLFGHRVVVWKLQQKTNANGRTSGPFQKVLVGRGQFLGWGIAYDDLTEGEGVGAGMFSTAIIEMEDGNIRNVSVRLIRFEQKNARQSWLERILAYLRMCG